MRAIGRTGWGNSASGGLTQYITDGASESESSTTSSSFVNKLLVSFTATLGVRYKIEIYCEIFAPDDQDVEAEGTLNTVQFGFSHFKNTPYADRWAQMNGCFFISSALSGNQDVRINFRNGYGAGAKKIRRARILVTRLD